MSATYNGDYFVNEGNKLGFMRTEFDGTAANNLTGDKFIADGALIKGRVVEVTGYDATLRGIKVKMTTASSAMAIGVAMFDYEDGEECAVETEGCFVLTASAAITVPTKIESAADGKVAGGDTNPIGIALTSATAADQRIYVKFSI